MQIGYHASHEQHSPRDLLSLVQLAERSGFQAAMCSDHLMPWSAEQGHSGFAWSWLGAALQATKLTFGVVNAPGYRYHPVIIAQAAATLAQMFPDRFWISVGSGEALNEHITGEPWPPKQERNERLLECVELMRKLWAGENVTWHGRIHAVDARLYSLPQRPPSIYGAALSKETAEWMGGWADGLITLAREPEKLTEILAAFRSGGGKGKPVLLQAKHSWARTEDEALERAYRQWKTNVFPSAIGADLPTPQHYEALSGLVSHDDVRRAVRVSADPERHVEWLRQDFEAGASTVYVHNVGENQQEFIETFGAEVIPALTSRETVR